MAEAAKGGKKVGAAAAVADLARAGLVDTGPSVDPAQLEAAMEFFRVAEKYLRALHTYDADHPSLLRFLDEVEARLQHYEERYEDLQVTLHPTAIALEGEIVYAAARVDDNMWFPLFGDGIRQLSFTGAGGRTEMVRFFDIIAELYSNTHIDEAGEDDSVTILWEAELEGISFVATSTFTEGRDNDNNPALATVREMINLSMMQELSGMALSGAAYASGELGRRVHSISLSSADLIFLESDNLAGLAEMPLRTRDVLGDLYRISAEQRQEFAAGCGIDPMVVERYLHAILAALAHVMEPVDAKALNIRAQLFLNALIHHGNYKRATDILATATATLSARRAESRDPALAAALDLPLLSATAAGDLMVALADFTRPGADADPDTVAQLFDLIETIPSSSAGTVVRLLDKIVDHEVRKRLCRLLSKHGDAILDAAAEVVLSWEEELARDLLDLVGAVAGERALAVLEHALGHPTPRIRAQALTMYLAGVAISTAAARAKKALGDDEILIRRVGCHYLARNRPPGARGWIEERINSSSFAGLELAEKKRLYFAYASIGGTSTIPWLRERLSQRNIFGKSSVDHERAAAALTLAQLRCEEARADIEKLARAKLTRGLVKEACSEALRLLDSPAAEFDAAPVTSGGQPVAVPSPPPTQRTQREFVSPSPATASTVVEAGPVVIAAPAPRRPTVRSANPAGMPMVTFRSPSPEATAEPGEPTEAMPPASQPTEALPPASQPTQAMPPASLPTEALPPASLPTEASPPARPAPTAHRGYALNPPVPTTPTAPTRQNVAPPPAAVALPAGASETPAWLQPTSLDLLDLPEPGDDQPESGAAALDLADLPADLPSSLQFLDGPARSSGGNPLDDTSFGGAAPAENTSPSEADGDNVDNVDDLLKNYLDD